MAPASGPSGFNSVSRGGLQVSRRKKALLWVLGAAAALAILLPVTGVLVVSSEWFREKVRLRLVEEVERASGGKVEIAAFHFDWRNLRAEVNGFVVRGNEPAEEPPLFQAESIVVGLRVISALDRDVNIALLAVRRPEINVTVDGEGNTNLPSPAAAGQPVQKNPIGTLLDLAIQRFEVTDGVLVYNHQRYPFSFAGESLSAKSVYEAAERRYRGEISARQLQVTAQERVPVLLDADVAWLLEEDKAIIERARVALGESSVELAGELTDLEARSGEFRIFADLLVADLVEPLELPVLPQGRVDIDGTVQIGSDGYAGSGRFGGSGLGWTRGHISIPEIGLSGNIEADSTGLRFGNLRATALEGSFNGLGEIVPGQSFRFEGTLEDLAMQRLAPSVPIERLAYSGILSGDVSLSGKLGQTLQDVVVNTTLTVTPAPGENPLEGEVAFEFRQADNMVQFGASEIATRSSRLEFSGSIADGIGVTLDTEDLDDLLPAIAMTSDEAPESLPVRIESGTARATGTISGDWTRLRFEGRLATGPVSWKDHKADRLTADIQADPNGLRISNLSLFQGRARLRGNAALNLSNWSATDESALSGELSLTGAGIRQMLEQAGQDLDADGTLSAAARLGGTLSEPSVLANLRIEAPKLYGEDFQELDAELRYSSGLLELSSARLTRDRGVLSFSANYQHPANNWKTGELQFASAGQSLKLAGWQQAHEFREGLDAQLTWDLNGTAEILDSKPRLTSLGGAVALGDLALEGRRLGDLQLQASTRDNVVTLTGAAGLANAKVTLGAEWSLRGNSFGLGQVSFTGLSLDSLKDVGFLGGPDTNIYVAGEMDGEVGFAGPILEPQSWQGMAKVTRLEITPTAGDAPDSDQDLTLRNSGPLIFGIRRDGISIESARMVSSTTDLNATGTLSFGRKNPWNLALKGTMELSVLSSIQNDLLAGGTSNIDAVVRGSLLEPQVNGRLEFDNASFYLEDLPNGLEQVNGAIIFDRTRATFETFTSRSGGGDVELGGFILFGGEELVYRLRATAKSVRIRYPEGVSTVLNASLAFTGTSARSLLSGEVAVTRAAFNPQTDLGSMLAETSSPVPPAEITNPFLRGMGFDIRVVTAGGAEVMTSLTRDIEMEADLVVRGGPARPVVIGNVSVNQGEVVFFGNKYTITQGDVRFFNPVKIEPVVAMDLETRVRGYTVMINFTGPMDKLNFSYRSDPPLESKEIIALLTVGRAPGQAQSGVGDSDVSSQSFLQAGGNTLLVKPWQRPSRTVFNASSA